MTSAYYDVLFLNAKLGFFKELDSLYSILNKSAETRCKLGDISQLDLMNAQAKKRQLSLDLEQLGFDISKAYQQLNVLLQTNESYTIPNQELALIPLVDPYFTDHVDLQRLRLGSDYLTSSIKIEKQKLLPDFNVGYFYGNTPQKDRRGYNGFEVGVSIPLYAGEQRAKMKAGQIALNANQSLIENELILLQNKYHQLRNELAKHQIAIDFYKSTGKQLSDEIIRSATKSYKAGAIDFYQFAMSMENSIKLQLDYYQAVSAYNQIAIQLNYITL